MNGTDPAPAPASEPDAVEYGMKLAVTHRTVFHYDSPVSESVNTLHLEPRMFPFQQSLGALVKILPATRVRRFTDLFQNITHHFELPRPHSKLEIESRIKVRNLPLEIQDVSRTARVAEYQDISIRERVWQFLQDSHLVPKAPEVWRQAVDLTSGHPAIFDQALSILHWVHGSFAYDPSSTHVHTRMDEAFAQKRGVCQDYAHVMIGLCRSVGIAARYASGYLYNGPRGTLLGAQASHAWCEVFLPGTGWIGFDPTNATLADARYIKIAVGRDYDDVAPVTGTYLGHGHCHMEVTVEVTKVVE